MESAKEDLVNVLRDLREKIETLEGERASLLAETKDLRNMAEARASKLKSEVATLKKEVKALKELLKAKE